MTVHQEIKKIKENQLVRRGEIYFADMGEGIGSEQNGILSL